MEVVTTVKGMQALSARLRGEGKIIGLIPTMGYLHPGHLSLIETAREMGGVIVVSIFVNPTQFSPNEDYAAYPRALERDLELCNHSGADVVFNPAVAEVYPKDSSTYIVEESLSRALCGVSRPHHFRGVTTIVGKLFNIARPAFSVFGQKDAQQVAIVRKMVADLHMGVEIIVAPTMREDDGLAMSSRNTYLSPRQRSEAIIIYQSLQKAKGMVESNIRNADRVVAEVTHMLATKRRVRVIYVSVVDRDTMEMMREIVPGRSMLAVACWVDEIRLIDNVLF